MQNDNLNIEENLNCVIHNSSIEHFCESCEEPICEKCTIQGPHNTNLHKIISLDIAYKSRISHLGSIINGNLLYKREEMNKVLSEFNNEVNILNEEKDKIINDVEIEFFN